MTSSNGITWSSQTTPADNNWQSVTFGNGLFVAVSSSGTGNRVMTSSNGSTWTLQTNPIDNNWASVAYGNGLFVAVSISGTGNRVMTSPDGITWTSRTSAANNNWQSITFGNGVFLAVSYSGTGNRVMSSQDGISWTLENSNTDNDWYGVTFGNQRFVAICNNGTSNSPVLQRTIPMYKLVSDAIITNFSVPTKTFGDSSFNIVDPSSNSPGAFTYTSSNTSVATISGNTITIVGVGTSTITATQQSTTNYTSGTAIATFQVNQATPTITNFSVPTKTFGDSPFNIVDPSSNSSGAFTYTSSNTSVATISGNTVTIMGIGTSTITATQSASGNYTSGTITAIFQVNQSTPTNPVIITNGNELLYFMNTTSTYGNIINSVQIDSDLLASSEKVLFTTSDNVSITKSV
jgi:hypothetical protein